MTLANITRDAIYPDFVFDEEDNPNINCLAGSKGFEKRSFDLPIFNLGTTNLLEQELFIEILTQRKNLRHSFASLYTNNELELFNFLTGVLLEPFIPTLAIASESDIQEKNQQAIDLIERWLADDSGYDETNWQYIKKHIEENRISYRARFHE
ncbi:MAG: hypothetical protein U9Q82_14155 [Chloroflexota bacterium]|nr:hypothetical protein [Chloroflexota bacterium]